MSACTEVDRKRQICMFYPLEGKNLPKKNTAVIKWPTKEEKERIAQVSDYQTIVDRLASTVALIKIWFFNQGAFTE